MSKRALVEDLIERMQTCLDDDFENFVVSDIHNWIIELKELEDSL